ncbi:glycosyltransferase family 4 protein [Mesorhizobium muleiense]|uniref:Glycosyltransferase involved in cell wall bisynthesis n=1 Tax=Mesorhizobium muleiense TaxID=1004279 RepID=A0A1G8L4E1_9HYPH|nr:glycosyltransferase family 4 protein [Mesorhizobium muleiense]MCF6100418.1 glycosyltransferase family 4 protein [Mesorhizobium muleiense]SDI50539.1 Glycosyltransferase involved in cell wall bisynthesis [Mesorhizobium muleiense]
MCGLKPHLLCIGGDDHFLRIPFFQALRDRGMRVSAAGTGGAEAFAEAGYDFYLFNMNRFIAPRADWASLRSLSRLIGEIRPTLIQCFDTKPDILVPFAAYWAGKVPVVSTINGLGWLYSSRSPLAVGLRPVFELVQSRADRLTAAIVFQNCADQAFFAYRRLIGKADHRVIPGSGIDVDRFDRLAGRGPSPAELRHELSLGDAPVVMTVTRLTREKGVPTLLEAAALVHRQAPEVRFLLVGPREREGALAIRQDEIDRHAPYVRAIGERSDVPALLQIADVFALATELREGVPRSLMEACAAGRPVITTDMPGCTDVVRDRWSGLVIPVRSPRTLAEAILQLLRDRDTALQYGARASAHVRKEFNLDITADRYAAVYQEVLARTRGRPESWERLAHQTPGPRSGGNTRLDPTSFSSG